MAESFRLPHGGDCDRIDADFAPEVDLVRDAATLPALSRQLRLRVLGAATFSIRQARRWTQVRQAASFLIVCLSTSLLLSPLPSLDWPSAGTVIAQLREIQFRNAPVAAASHPFELPTSSAWALRDNREFLGMTVSAWSNVRDRRPTTVARSVEPFPADERLAALQASEGWATVEAFRALRSAGHAARLASQLTN